MNFDQNTQNGAKHREKCKVREIETWRYKVEKRGCIAQPNKAPLKVLEYELK